jgi:membrane fusion protein, multidrug efflux system
MLRNLQIALLSALLACTWLAGCEKEKQKTVEVIRPVRTITVGATEAGRQRAFSGTAHAGLESRLSFKVPGTLKRLAVNAGDKVKKGALIGELDAKDFDLQVEQARANLTQAQAQSRNAKAAYARARELYTNRSVSKGELDAARAGSETAEASVKAASKQVQLLRQQRGYTRLTAPLAGSIAAVKVEINENVGAGQVVAVLTSGKDIEVRVTVPESVISKIKKGSKVMVSFDALPGKNFPSTVIEVGVSSVESGSTFPVAVQLDNTDPAIRAGMAAEVTFEFEKKTDKPRILIPAVAVGEDRRGRFVYLALETEPGFGKVVRRVVEVGELTGEGLEISNGLKAGDIVVTAGLSFLEDGRKVRLPKTKKIN